MWSSIIISTSYLCWSIKSSGSRWDVSFELSAYPLSIFEKPILLRNADKPKLADAIVKFVKEHCDEVSQGEGSELMNEDALLLNDDIEMEILVENVSNDSSLNYCIQHEKAAVTDSVSNDDTHQYVIDGGSLLHRISWEKQNVRWNRLFLLPFCTLDLWKS